MEIDSGEYCDGTNLNEETCITLGYDAGTFESFIYANDQSVVPAKSGKLNINEKIYISDGDSPFVGINQAAPQSGN